MTGEFRRVLMTCRTQFFPAAEEEPRRTGVIKLGSVKAGQEAVYIFHKLYLSPFDDKQVQKYLRLRQKKNGIGKPSLPTPAQIAMRCCLAFRACKKQHQD